MSSRNTEAYLKDIILTSSKTITDFLAGMDVAAYKADLKTRSAVERRLQNLTEPAFRLGKDAETLCPIVDWRSVRGLGNVLRHEYDDIVDDVIWEAIHYHLPQLRAAFEVALHQLDRQGSSPA